MRQGVFTHGMAEIPLSLDIAASRKTTCSWRVVCGFICGKLVFPNPARRLAGSYRAGTPGLVVAGCGQAVSFSRDIVFDILDGFHAARHACRPDVYIDDMTMSTAGQAKVIAGRLARAGEQFRKVVEDELDSAISVPKRTPRRPADPSLLYVF